MVTLDEFSRVVGEIYAASLDPAGWTAALADLTKIFESTGCALTTGRGPERVLLASAVAPATAIPYRAHFHSLDYVMEAVDDAPVGAVQSGSALVALAPRSEFAMDFLRPFDMMSGLFVRLTAGPAPISLLVPAATRSDPYESIERVRFANAITRHLQQALRLQANLRYSARAADEVSGIIDANRHGVVIVDSRRTVLHLNPVARQTLTADDGLRLCSTGLSFHSTQFAADDPAVVGSLEKMLDAALVPGPAGVRIAGCLTCPRPSGNRPYVIHVVPLAAAHHAPTAMVLIIDPARAPATPAAVLSIVFGLTRAEAEVARRLLSGDGPASIAEHLAVSPTTVKTHLQHIFDKTGTHRQSQLVSLLHSVFP